MKKLYKNILLLTLPTSTIIAAGYSIGYFAQQTYNSVEVNESKVQSKKTIDSNFKSWFRKKNKDTDETITQRADGWITAYNNAKTKNSDSQSTEIKDNFHLFSSIIFKNDETRLNIIANGLDKTNTSIMDTCRLVIQKIQTFAIAYDITKNSKYLDIYKEITFDFTTYYYRMYDDLIGNWWNYMIGVPKDFLASIIFVYKDLNKEEINKLLLPITWFLKDYKNRFSYDGLLVQPMKLANLVDTSYSVILFSHILNDKAKLDEVVNYLLSDLFGFWTKKDVVLNRNGFYEDGSYVDHSDTKTKSGGLAYFGGYGIEFISGILDIKMMLSGTEHDLVTYDVFGRFYEIIETVVMPYMFELSFSDSLSGRSISRKNYNNKVNGRKIIEILIYFVDDAPVNYKNRLINFILEQTSSPSISHYLTEEIKDFRSKYSKVKEFKRYLSNDWIETNHFDKFNNDDKNKVIPVGIDLFKENNGMLFSKNQDRYLVKKDDYMFTLSLPSSRNNNFEIMNGENVFGLYQGDGLTLIQNKDIDNYGGNYWTAVDPYKLPGTSSVYEKDVTKMTDDEITKNIEASEHIDGKSQSKFGNGIFYNNIGLATSLIDNYNSSLQTNKGYFFIDGLIFVVGQVSATNVTPATSEGGSATLNLETSKTTSDQSSTTGNLNAPYNVYTTVLNDLAITEMEQTDLTSNHGAIKKIKSLSNSYYILNGYSASNLVSKKVTRTVKPYSINKSRKSEAEVTETFNEVYFDHKNSEANDKQKQFAYVIAPSESNQEDTLNKINRIKIVSKTYSDYFCIEYEDDKNVYSLISTFNENQMVETNGLSLTFSNPTSTILMRNKTTSEYWMINSSNDSQKNYSIKLNRSPQNFRTRKVNGLNEVECLFDTIYSRNDLYWNSDTNHNTWCRFY